MNQKLEDFLATRKDATPEDLESIRGLYNVLKSEFTQVDLEPYAKRADFDELKVALTKLEDAMPERQAPKSIFGDEKLEAGLRSMFNAIKEGDRKGVELEKVSTRAAAVMTLADAIANAPDFVKTTVDKTVHSTPEPRLAIVNRLNRGVSRTAVTRYTMLANSEGNAAVTEEGALKPLYSTVYDSAEATVKKVAVRIKVSEEFESFTEFYRDLIMRAQRQLAIVTENEVVNGAGGVGHLTGITSVAPAFNVPALAGTVASPDLVDVILAAMTQIQSLGFTPRVAFVNFLDYAALKFLKEATTNRPMSAENLARLEGITIVPVDANSIAKGKVLVMDDMYWQLFVNELIVREGYGVSKVGTEYLSDLDVNVRTIIFELFVKSYCPAPELASMVYDDIATIKTAIAKP